ncbi:MULTISPECIES: hypothetical protein [unclassified Ensifer]|uniref:hypothetical protein n=1 Tax=unclassified Ensifer TaxID=2633371 RepID=UPI00070F634F|nr:MULTISPECIES: hypothetical protein [unclassified Ensifer]KQY78802.1 hypothetical protein ASD52_02960 [Ensifer sp. Root142]OMQ44390.1 hypothetical protein BKP54_12685 [Ensifer sp. 1H6]
MRHKPPAKRRRICAISSTRFQLISTCIGWKTAGHGVVHGGDRFQGAVRLDDANIAAIEKLTDLAPLHQPQG